MRNASWIVRFGQHTAENNEWCSLQHGIVFLWSVIHSFLWWLHSGCYFTLVSVWKDWPMNEHQMWCQLLEWSDSIRNGVTWYTLLHFLCRSLLAFFVHWFQPACNAFCVCVCQCWCWAVFNLGEEKMQSTWRHAGWPAVSLGYWMLHLMMVPVSTCAETYFLHVLRTNQICCCCCS